MYNGERLKTEKSVVYLGTTFIPSGTYQPAETRQAENSSNRPILFLLKRGFYSDKNYSIQPLTSMKLFDAYVKPILLFGCQIWAPSTYRNRVQPNDNPHAHFMINLDTTEKVHTDFCKYTLGLTEQATNAAVICELGRNPIELDIKLLVYKYWQRLVALPDSHILKEAYIDNVKLDASGKRVWVSCVKNLLESVGLNYVWNDPVQSCSPQYIRSLLHDQHIQRLHSDIFNDDVKHGTGNKLRTFREFSDLLHCEDYLVNVKKFRHRKALSKLRTSNHKLQIETGRHNKTPLPQRLCNICHSGDIENEFHFLCNCSTYFNLRGELYSKIAKILPGFNDFNPSNKIKVLLQPRGQVAVHVAQYVFDCFKKRNQVLSYSS